MKKILWVFSLCSLMSSGMASGIDEIIKKTNLASFYAGDNGRSDARMIIVDHKGNKQMRQFVIHRQDVADGGDQNFLVVFARPSDVRGTVFLVHKKTEDEDARWLYLPALDLEKRISTSDNRTSFVGSDYFYEDVSGRHPTLDKHELIGSSDNHYLIKSTPKDPGSVEFSSYQLEIDKTTFLPMKIEFSDVSGDVYRRIEVVEVQNIQGHPTVMKAKASNLKTNGYTLLEFRRPSYDIKMSNSMFTARSLRNPPK